MNANLHIQSKIQWQDLRHLTKWQVAYNVILPYPFLALSWYFASQSAYLVAMVFSYFFVITAYRQGHDLFHQALGTHRYVTTALLFVISILSFSSLHSMKYSHLLHHQKPLSDNDVEGYLAHQSWYEALLGGLLFRYRLYRHGFALAPTHQKRKIILESLAIGAMAIGAFYFQSQVLIYQFMVMFVMNAFAGVLAVWALHHDIDENEMKNGLVARTERNRLANMLTFNLMYHAEHHLFPAVPTSHLPELARRIDEKLPVLTSKKVLPFSQSHSPDETCPFRGLFIS